MTVTLPKLDAVDAGADISGAVGQASDGVRAGWWARARAFAVDVFFGTGVVITCVLVAQSASISGLGWLRWTAIAVAAVVFLAMAVNRLLLPSITGATLGRALSGIVVVSRDGAPIGPWRLLLRDLAHLLDTAALFLGWLWPLWDSRNRTFADLIVRTEVRRVEAERPDGRRLAGAVLVALAVLAAAASLLGYFGVYRPELAVEQAREQIAVRGPELVEQMLSYNVATTDADFARARGLVTDGYRPKVLADQDDARKRGLANTEYWVVNSSVLTNTRDRAEMLIFILGQRGEAAKLRPSSATLRVTFARSGSGQWLVDNLSVLARPNPGQPK
ncbi:RDD family protein [Mycolicibacterium vinylchloridicum]|uniref:RDD family protein n=1 Tax=Mycolicibacterium vinylchloridicum TaxID=2736928 RepID=UPI0015C91E97|nr:RDD family protein [Mycolicibacterium vinylchloridicum]